MSDDAEKPQGGPPTILESPGRGKTIHLVSLGCVKNRVDSEVMLGVAEQAGFVHVERPEDAEVILVNTCGFIGEAKQESIETIFEMAAHKESGACQRLVVAGCLSQRHPQELAAEMPEVDHFLGSSDMLGLRSVLIGKAERMLVGDPASWLIRATDPRTVSTGRASAYVKIAEGCNRSCSFCIIPQLRGKQRSRSADDIVREVEALAQAGVFEINLISQDTIAYGRDLDGPESADLETVVRRVADVAGVRWVRLFYLYPETMTDGVVELLAHHPRVLPYIDMPLQHAADGMLRRMRRGHGGARLRKLVDRVRREIPGLVFRTAFIVGHPGETDQEFSELLDFVHWAEFDRVAAFRYSDEDGVLSQTMDHKVPEKVAAARFRKLMALQRPISRAKNQKLVGSKIDVIVEGASDEHEYVLMGRHAGQAPEIDGQVYLSGGEATPGTLRTVEITQASDYDLVGELQGDSSSDLRRVAAIKSATSPRVSLRVVPASYR
jgi:ribosomal protein S12 methylthiotransferase